MNNSVNNVKDSNDHKDSDLESDDSRTNPKPTKSMFNKSTLGDSDKNIEVIELHAKSVKYTATKINVQITHGTGTELMQKSNF